MRKGSMGTPAEVLQAFWQELRGRTRITIEHPDLPDALKQVAAEAIKTIWQAANEAATGELATLRAEARHAASAAEAERDAARAETAAAREEVGAVSAQLAEVRQAHDAVQADLAAERQAHAATQARLEAGRAELDAAGRQLAELLTMEELAAAGCFDPPSPPPPPPPPPPPVVCYRNAAGQSWDGWLRRAVNAGQSVEFYRVG